jgi:hypothetical protein
MKGGLPAKASHPPSGSFRRADMSNRSSFGPIRSGATFGNLCSLMQSRRVSGSKPGWSNPSKCTDRWFASPTSSGEVATMIGVWAAIAGRDGNVQLKMIAVAAKSVSLPSIPAHLWMPIAVIPNPPRNPAAHAYAAIPDIARARRYQLFALHKCEPDHTFAPVCR